MAAEEHKSARYLALANQDLLLQCLESASTSDLRKCRSTCRSFNSLIRDRSSLQYRLALEDLSLLKADVQKNDTSIATVLAALTASEERMTKLSFGQLPNSRESVTVKDWGAIISGLVAEANDRIYFAGGYNEHTQEATHIEILNLKNLNAPRQRIEFGHSIKAFMVNAYEDRLTVVWLEEEQSIPYAVFHHRTACYALQNANLTAPDLRSFRFPWSLSQVRRAPELTSSRGRYMSVCCIARDDYAKDVVRIYDLQAGKLIHESAQSVPGPGERGLTGCDIVSTRAALIVWSYGPQVELRLLALGNGVNESGWPGTETGAVHVATYHLPQMRPDFQIPNISIHSSPQSTACASRGYAKHDSHAMIDGDGIITIVMYVRGQAIDASGPLDPRLHGPMMMVLPIALFHNEASRGVSSPLPAVKKYPWAMWGPRHAVWTPRPSQKSTRDSICGYRLITCLDQADVRRGRTREDTSDARPADEFPSTLTVFDFNPVNINRHRGRVEQGGHPETLMRNDSSPLLDPSGIFLDDPRTEAKYLVSELEVGDMRDELGLTCTLNAKRLTMRSLIERGGEHGGFDLKWTVMSASTTMLEKVMEAAVDSAGAADTKESGVPQEEEEQEEETLTIVVG